MLDLTALVFRTLFPEFHRIPDNVVDAFINIAITRVPLTVWIKNTQYGQGLLTAHMLASRGLGGLGSGGGAVNNEQVGDLSRGFSPVFQAGSGDAELETTNYGVQFIALRNETIISFGTTRPSSIPFRSC